MALLNTNMSYRHAQNPVRTINSADQESIIIKESTILVKTENY